MAEDDDRSSKTEAPSKRRLDEARRKGDVVKSPDVAQFAALAAACAVVAISGGAMARGMGQALLPFLAHPDAISLSGQGGVVVMRLALTAAWPALTVLLAASAAGVAGNLIQHGLLWAPSKLAPEFSRLNPLAGLGRVFGLDAFMTFAKSLVKILAVGVVAWAVLKPRAAMLAELPALNPAAILPLSAEILRALAIAILVVMAAVAGFDWFWARTRFMAKMRMSREELKQDTKESEGDPHIKARLKQIRIQRSRKRMIQNVPKATMVVMNPTHYAVALRYVQGETPAPLCVAKGLDKLALKIRDIAEVNAIPVIEDPPLARSLYAAIEVDETIPPEHYRAVAQIIGFIMGQGSGRRGAAAEAARTRPGPATARPPAASGASTQPPL